MNKKKLLLVIAESRSTYDFSFCINEEERLSFDLVSLLHENKTLQGYDELLFSSVSPVSKKDLGDEWHYYTTEGTWYNQSLIEAGYLDEEDNLHVTYKNSFMGKCFNHDEYAYLSKENGFGNYEMKKIKDTRTIKEKVTEYIDELSQTYDISEIIYINDHGYSEEMLDEKYIEKLGIKYTTIIPNKPWCSQSSGLCDRFESINITSSEISIEGAVDCLQRYNQYIAQNKNNNYERKLI